MKLINFSILIAALLLIANTSFAQSSEARNKAVISTDKLDSQLKSENPALALNDSQKEKIVALQIQRMAEVSAYRKNNSDKGEVKAKSKELNKAMNAKISKEILTPEQAKAQKEYRQKMKAKKGKGGAKTSMKAKGAKPMPPAVKITDVEADKMFATANAKEKEKAEKATEKFNASIIASDANLALSADQKKEINALNLKRILERSKMIKAGMDKDEIKIKNKELVKSTRKMIMSVLTKEQKDAYKASK